MFHLAFTSRYQGKTNVIRTDVIVENIYNNKSIKVTAVWDTGATHTTITRSVAQKIGCIATDIATMKGVGSSPKTVDVYDVAIILPNKVKFDKVKVLSTSSIGGCDILIGMDIITAGDFAITNINNKTTVSFCIPSYKEICFVKNTTKANIKARRIKKNQMAKRKNP